MSFSLAFDNHTPITDATDLYILANDLVIRKADNRFYRSYVCEKNTKLFNRDELMEYNKQNLILPETVTLLILKEDHTHLVYDKVTDIKHFVDYLRFASRVICNLKLLEENICLDGIFVNMDRINAKMWKTNKILLTNTNYRDFAKMHFQGEPVEVHGYDFNPLTNPKYKKYLHKIRYTMPEAKFICTQEDFNWMIAYLVELDLQNLVVRIMRAFLLSIEFCQLALKCPHLRSVIDTYPEVSGYMIYAMRIMYLEEREKYGCGMRAPSITGDERFLFTLEDVEGLPQYKNFSWDNPYFLEPGFGMSTKQQLWIPAYIKGTRGIYSRDIAMQRFQEYTGGVLKDLQWNIELSEKKSVRTVLCGSAIPAIFIHNVLESYYDADYFQEFYPAQKLGRREVDIETPSYDKPLYTIEEDEEEEEAAHDEVYSDEHIETDLEPLTKLELAHQHLMNVRKWKDAEAEKEAKRAYLDAVAEDRKQEELLQTVPRIRKPHKVSPKNIPEKDKSEASSGENVDASDNIIDNVVNEAGNDNNKLCESNQKDMKCDNAEFPDKPDNELTDAEKQQDRYTDMDLMIETDDFEVFDLIAATHFSTILANVSDIDKSGVYMRVIYTENKYKYKIYGLPRPIEIFMVGDIPSTISKFHMAPVRAWWDGNNLHMFPTFIAAAMTSICFDMRWVSCAKDLRDIVLKYFQRGFTQILNKQEAVNILTYLNNSPKWLTWTMPIAWGGWRARQWATRAIYYEKEEIFNPSACNKGIHYGLHCGRQAMRPLEYMVKLHRYAGFNVSNKCVSRGILKTKIVNPSKVSSSWAYSYK